MDPAVAQPGIYSAAIAIGEDAPGSVDAVDVTMTVTPPAAWGKLVGTVNGRVVRRCRSPLRGGHGAGGLVGRVVDVRHRQPTASTPTGSTPGPTR